jgi:hypothetical protein
VPNKYDRDMKKYMSKINKVHDVHAEESKPFKPKKMRRKRPKVVAGEEEKGDDNIPVPTNFGTKLRRQGSNLHNPEIDFTSELAKQRAQMIDKLTEQFNEIGDGVFIPDGYLTAQRYVSKKANVQVKHIAVASFGVPEEHSFVDKGDFAKSIYFLPRNYGQSQCKANKGCCV